MATNKMADRRRIAAMVIVSILFKRKRQRKRERSVREKEWLKRRGEKSVYREILQELRLEDEQNYRRYLRMDTATFEVFFIIRHFFQEFC